MGIRTIYRHPKTSAPAKSKEGVRPYLLKSLQIIDVDKVRSSDITYLQIDAKNLGAASDFMMPELAPPKKSDKCKFVDVLALVSAQEKPETEARAIFRGDGEP